MDESLKLVTKFKSEILNGPRGRAKDDREPVAMNDEEYERRLRRAKVDAQLGLGALTMLMAETPWRDWRSLGFVEDELEWSNETVGEMLAWLSTVYAPDVVSVQVGGDVRLGEARRNFRVVVEPGRRRDQGLHLTDQSQRVHESLGSGETVAEAIVNTVLHGVGDRILLMDVVLRGPEHARMMAEQHSHVQEEWSRRHGLLQREEAYLGRCRMHGLSDALPED